jgi:hypothetical protein
VVFNVDDLKEAGRIAETSGVRVTREFCLNKTQMEIAFAGAVTRFDEIVLDFETSGIPMVLANIELSGSQSADEPS